VAHRHLERLYAVREQIPAYLGEIVQAHDWYYGTPEDLEGLAEQLRGVYRARGAPAFWRAYLESQLRNPATHRLALARIYAHLGDRDGCMAVLEKLFRERELMLAAWIKSDPEFDNVRSDPRYQALLKQIGFPE
jgi:hypothetical protein